jgi:hypothetical protein
MSEQLLAQELLRPILDAWLHRNERAAAEKAGTLMFWRDGMLKELEQIAAGKATEEMFVELERKINSSEVRVEAALAELRKLRNRLAGAQVADQIDQILHNTVWDKFMTRRHIEAVLRQRKLGATPEAVQEMVRGICGSIKTLNSQLERLHRMVYVR